MRLPLPVGIVLSTCLSLAAQGTQDPQKQLSELNAEKARLQREIEFVKSRVTNAKALLKSNIGRGMPAFRTIDAGKSAVAQPAAPPVAPRPARLMADDERANFTGDTMLVVNGSPIRQQQYDELMTYQATLPGDEAQTSVRSILAIADLVRIEAIATTFAESDAEPRLADALSEVEAGKSFEDVVKERGSLRDAPADGRIQVTRRSPYGVRFEQVAFSTPPGARSRPFRHHTGLVVLKVEDYVKGAAPEVDKVVARVLCIPYAEPEAIAKAESALANGQVEIIARDKDVLRMLPPGFQDPDEVRAAAQQQQLETLAQSVARIEAEIEALRASGKEEDKEKLREMERRRDVMKSRLAQMRGEQQGAPETPKKD